MDKLIRDLGLLASGNIAGTDFVEIQEDDQVITKKVTVTVLNELEKAERVAQDNTIEAGVGLTAAGDYDTPVGTNYLNSTTDVMDALETLDGIIGGGGELRVERVSVSTANLNNAGIAPYEIIAAAGAGQWIEVIACSIFLDFDAAAVECGSQKLILEYDTGASHFLEWSNTFIEGVADAASKGTWTSNVTMLANKKVQLTFDGGANPTAGDAQLKVWITYIIRDDGTT